MQDHEINVVKSDPDLATLCNRIEDDSLKLSPKYQRKAHLWGSGQRSRLIESFILGIPVPPVFVALNTTTGESDVIDGLQRLETIRTYLKNSWALNHMEFAQDLTGLRFNKLPDTLQRRLKAAPLTLYTVPSNTPRWGEGICNVIFERVNSGLSLNRSERARGVDQTGHLRNLGDELTPMIRDMAQIKGDSKRSIPWNIAIGVVLGMQGTRLSDDMAFMGEPLKNSGSDPCRHFTDLLQNNLDAKDGKALDQRTALAQKAKETLERIRASFGECSLRNWSCGAERPSTRLSQPLAMLQAFWVQQVPQGTVLISRYQELCRQRKGTLFQFDRPTLMWAIETWEKLAGDGKKPV